MTDAPVLPVRSTFRWVALGVLAVVVLAVILLSLRPSSEGATGGLVGKRAPEFRGVSVDGVEVLRNPKSYLVVNFFASWCVPCRDEHPELVRFASSEHGREVQLVAVAFDQADVASATKFFVDNHGTWPLVTDPNGKLAVGFGVHGLPATFVVDPDGVVAAQLLGRVTETWLVEATTPKVPRA